MGGEELMRIVSERWPGITRVLMTGCAAESALGSQDEPILEKPFSASDLTQLLERRTDRR